MFCKVFLFTFTLALLAEASPVKTSGRCIHIPLSKPPTVTKPDGTFDLEKAILIGIATQNKHRQNLMNLEHNVGRKVFNEGAKILPLATVPVSLQRRNSEPLTYTKDWGWTGVISIGTPAKEFTVEFDLGSTDLWVMSTACTSPAPLAEAKYDASKSSTSTFQSNSFKIEYDSGGSVSGPIYTDNVTLAGVEVNNQHFSPVTSISSPLDRHPMDGMLGLAFPGASQMKQKSFIETAFHQRRIHENAFSMKLAKSGSSLFIGGSDDKLYTGPMEYHKVGTELGLWKLSGAEVRIGSNPAVSDFHTIIDSGSVVIFGPPSAVDNFYSRVRGARRFSIHGYYSIPCSSMPDVSFNWGGKDWVIFPENFNLGVTFPGSSLCIGAIVAHDLGLGTNVWLLGAKFIMNMYVKFSFARNTVGFAELA